MSRMLQTAMAALLFTLTASCSKAANPDGEKILLPAKERQVSVTYFQAEAAGPHPAVLLLHGAAGFERQIKNYNLYATALAHEGFDAYLVNYRSDEDMKQLAAGNNVFEDRFADWAKLVDDLADYLKTQKNSNGKIGLIGFSDGGTLTSAASALDKNITAAVVYYGMDAENVGMEETRFPPILILHGDADTTIPWSQGEQLAGHVKALGAPIEFVLYPGVKHGFGANLDKWEGADALKRTIAFFHQRFK